MTWCPSGTLLCTSWSRQLATCDGATPTRASTRCYQLLPPWYHPYIIMLLLLSPACCVGWCVVRERFFFVVDCCVAEGIVVEHCCCCCCCTCSAFFGPRTTRHEGVREETSTKTERSAFGGYLLHVVQFGRGGTNVRCCCCVAYQFVEMRCARFYVNFCGSM